MIDHKDVGVIAFKAAMAVMGGMGALILLKLRWPAELAARRGVFVAGLALGAVSVLSASLGLNWLLSTLGFAEHTIENIGAGAFLLGAIGSWAAGPIMRTMAAYQDAQIDLGGKLRKNEGDQKND